MADAFLPQIPAAGRASAEATKQDAQERVPPPGDDVAPGARWLPVAVSPDPGDPKLAHLDGLNLSRAWMLEGVLSGLPAADPRRPSLRAAAEAHRRAGLAAVTGEHYEGGHWLGSFAVYLVTARGVAARGDQ